MTETIGNPSDRRLFHREIREERLLARIPGVAGDPARFIRCRTIDVSAEGLQLLSEEPLPTNLTVELWVNLSDSPGKFLLHCRVIWTHMQDGHFLSGVILFQDSNIDDWDDWRALFAD